MIISKGQREGGLIDISSDTLRKETSFQNLVIYQFVHLRFLNFENGSEMSKYPVEHQPA